MKFRTVANTAVGAVVLAVIGAVMGPAWDPTPVPDPIEPVTTSTQVSLAGGPPIGTYEVEQRIVDVQLDGTVVRAKLTMPQGADGPVPGVVFIHGAGTGKFADAFRTQSAELATAGIATLVPDKRLDTYTLRHRDYVAMAADYARSVEVLRGVPGVDPDRVGIYAESEGGWIAPVLAANDAELGFTVLVSAPVVQPRQQAAFAVDNYLRNTGVPSDVFRAIPRAVGMALPGGGFEYADFEVTRYQRAMTQPVLIVFGTNDPSMPLVQGTRLLAEDLAYAGNDAWNARFYDGANHGIKVDGVMHPAFMTDLAGWVNGLPQSAGAEPRIAGATPHQTYLAQPLVTPSWFGDGDVVLGLVIGGLAVVLLAGAAAVVSWFVRRPVGLAAELWRPLVGLGVGVVLTIVALVWYLFSIAMIALEYERDPWTVQGGWVVVRVLGLASVLALAILLQHVRAVSVEPERVLAKTIRGYLVLWSAVAGASLLLVLLAYWGVFQLGI